MTLDLQLCNMAMELWMEREAIKKHFLFHPGELHIIFWAALGKYVEGSGIDQHGLRLDFTHLGCNSNTNSKWETHVSSNISTYCQYDEVRLVFNRYITTSLKAQMRTNRTKGKELSIWPTKF